MTNLSNEPKRQRTGMRWDDVYGISFDRLSNEKIIIDHGSDCHWTLCTTYKLPWRLRANGLDIIEKCSFFFLFYENVIDDWLANAITELRKESSSLKWFIECCVGGWWIFKYSNTQENTSNPM